MAAEGVVAAEGVASTSADLSKLQNSNTMNHIFREKHTLDLLLNEFGSRETPTQAIHEATQFVAAEGVRYTTGAWFTVRVGESLVSVRNAVLDGVFRISSATMRPF